MRCALLILLFRIASAADFPAVQSNDNRHPAGVLAAGVLTVRLEVRQALWNPEGENGPQLPVHVFGEENQPPSNPGPLLRVPAGIVIRASVRNLLAGHEVFVHGLNAHSGADSPPVAIPPLATREVEFRALRPGVYFYWGATSAAALDKRDAADSQLSAAFVVDPPNAGVEHDRIFVMGHWYIEGNPKATPPVADRETWVINGKSWPHTERLSYAAEERVRWLWINATDEGHPLHMHGHYFTVESRGGQQRWLTLPLSKRRLAATEVLPSGESLALEWTPTRPGNWLFHCHILFHVAPELRQTPDPPETHHADHDGDRHMAGLVLGITISRSPATSATDPTQPRRLQLVVGERAGVTFGKLPGLGYQLTEGDGPGGASPGFHAPGPPIVLTRGQPVEIAIENRLSQATSVHWHGIELESYYDGVPGWGGEGKHITPPILPGGTFVARFTPPRAGTFMYHTHLNDYVQLSTGLYGPLVVMEPGSRFDPESDKIFLLSRGGPDDEKDPFLVNGESPGTPIELRAGRTYRFRFIGITPAPNLKVELTRDGHPVTWTAIAKDGATLAKAQALSRPATLDISPGETYDFEVRAGAPGQLTLRAVQPFFKLETVVPVIVRPGR